MSFSLVQFYYFSFTIIYLHIHLHQDPEGFSDCPLNVSYFPVDIILFLYEIQCSVDASLREGMVKYVHKKGWGGSFDIRVLTLRPEMGDM